VKQLIYVFLLLIPLSSFCCEIKVGVREFPPYSMKDDKDNWSGIDITIFNTLFSQVGCDLIYIDVAFGDSLLLLKDGEIDAMSQLSKAANRVEAINFLGPIRLEELSLLTSKEVSEKITHLEMFVDLPYFFGKRAETYVGKEFHYLYDNNEKFAQKFIPMNSNIARIDLVLKNRVVGFFDETLFNQYHLDHNQKYSNMKIHPIKIFNGPVFIGLSKKTITDDMFKKLSDTYQRLKQQGKI